MGVASFTSLAPTATKSGGEGGGGGGWKEAIVCNLISDILLCMSTSCPLNVQFLLAAKGV